MQSNNVLRKLKYHESVKFYCKQTKFAFSHGCQKQHKIGPLDLKLEKIELTIPSHSHSSQPLSFLTSPPEHPSISAVQECIGHGTGSSETK